MVVLVETQNFASLQHETVKNMVGLSHCCSLFIGLQVVVADISLRLMKGL